MGATELNVSLALSEEVSKSLAGVPQAAIESALRDTIAKLAEPEPIADAKQVEFRRSVLTKAEGEERYGLFVVLEPDTKDSQNDIYTAAEVRKASHRFMQAYRSGDKEGHMGVMHKRLADEEIVIVENYLAKNDETIGGQAVKAGTWLQGLIFKSDTLWEQVKTGKMTGLSIGGSAIRTVVEA